jgi:hypothetical protein
MNRARYFFGNASSFILITTGIMSASYGIVQDNLVLLSLGLAELGLLTGLLAITIQINEVGSE